MKWQHSVALAAGPRAHGKKAGDYLFAFCALNFAHRALAAAEILALAAALIRRFLRRGAPFSTGAA